MTEENNDRLSVDLAGLTLKNPIIPASGTVDYGEPLMDHYDLGILGALVIKTTTLEARKGAPDPKFAHTDKGILNAVGLKNPGIEAVLAEKLPALAQYDLPIIASVAGKTIEDYVEVTQQISQAPNVVAIEVNASCPNVAEGGLAFGTNPNILADLTRQVKTGTNLPVFVKLSPNVTDIAVLAQAAEEAGADGLVSINTVTGLAIDIESRQAKLGNVTGGLSAGSLKHIALRMVHQVAQAVSIPVVGVGGMSTIDDVIEMLMAGATAVQIGSENYLHPMVCKEIIEGLPDRLDQLGIDKIKDIKRFDA